MREEDIAGSGFAITGYTVAKNLGGDAALARLRERLPREARLLARLSHPNVVEVHDVGTLGDQVFVALALVDGGTLTEWLRAAPRAVPDVPVGDPVSVQFEVSQFAHVKSSSLWWCLERPRCLKAPIGVARRRRSLG